MAHKKHETKKSAHKTHRSSKVHPKTAASSEPVVTDDTNQLEEIEARDDAARFVEESPAAAHEAPAQDAVEVTLDETVNAAGEADAERKKIHIDFYGSETLRSRAPKAFELAEAVAEEWVNDGRFEGLPVGSPLAQFAAQLGLRKAKDIEKKIEKKLEDTGVLMIAKSAIATARNKWQR